MTIEQLVIGSWGEIKTAKSTFGLSFPNPLVHLDFDLGFERASNRIPPNLQIVRVPYNIPLTEKILSQGDIITKMYKIPIRFPKQAIAGILALWEEQIIADIITILGMERIKSILYDTGTVMWGLDKDAQLERAQQNNKTRINLTEIEYATPNQEMRAVLGHCKYYGKNLYIPHHVGGIYEERLTNTGTKSVRVGDTWDGWKHMGAIVDVILKTQISRNGQGITPEATIETCGYTLSAEGLTLANPTFESILNTINTLMESERNSVGTAILPRNTPLIPPIIDMR